MSVCRFRGCLAEATEPLRVPPPAKKPDWDTAEKKPERKLFWCREHGQLLDGIRAELDNTRPPKNPVVRPSAPVTVRHIEPTKPKRLKVPKAERARTVREFLAEQDGAYVTRPQIAEHIGMKEGGGLSRILSYAVEQGLIERHESGERGGYRVPSGVEVGA